MFCLLSLLFYWHRRIVCKLLVCLSFVQVWLFSCLSLVTGEKSKAPGTILQVTQHGGLTSSAAVNPQLKRSSPQPKPSPSQPNPSPPQPVDIVGSKKLKFFCQLRNMFRVVILHEHGHPGRHHVWRAAASAQGCRHKLP